VVGNVCLLGVGNVLTGDDALGPYVLRMLEARWTFGPEVTILDAGTPGLDLTMFLDGYRFVIAVDAIKAKGQPGEIRSYRKAELLARPLPIVTSPHEPTLREALMRLQLVGREPEEFLLVGAIPDGIATGAPLSAKLRATLPELERLVVEELIRLGVRVESKSAPSGPEIWWESPAASVV
jgi:hydrogenase maturation protease